MKTYQKVEIEVIELEEDVVRTSVIESTAEKLNGFDDLIFNFGA